MSDLTNKFVRKPFYVSAVQVSMANIEDVAQWCGGDVRTGKTESDVMADDGHLTGIPAAEAKYVKVNVYKPQNDRQTKAFVGDWILFSGTGYKVYKDQSFQRTFELAEGSI